MKFEEEIKKGLILSVVVLIILKIVFFNESFPNIIKVFYGIFYFTLPGIIATYIFFVKMKFVERFAIGFILGFAVLNMLTYYINVFLNIPVYSMTQYLSYVVAFILALVLRNRKKLFS